jgi:hypothetical protein
MKVLGTLIGVIGLMIAMTACTGQTPSSFGRLETRDGATSIDLALGEKIAIVGAFQSEDLDDFLGCVGPTIRSANAAIPIIADEEFRTQVSPWFDSMKVLNSDRELMGLIQQPEVQHQFTKLGLRYLVIISGSVSAEADVSSSGAADVLLAAKCNISEHSTDAPLANAGLVLRSSESSSASTTTIAQLGVSWDEYAVLFAHFWDLKQAYSLGRISSTATGGGGAGVTLFIVPFLFLPDTEATVCDDVGWRLAQFFSGSKLVRPSQ